MQFLFVFQREPIHIALHNTLHIRQQQHIQQQQQQRNNNENTIFNSVPTYIQQHHIQQHSNIYNSVETTTTAYNT